MLELHLGKTTTFSAQDFIRPAVLLGLTGQGKSVFLLQLALELIRNNESGALYDPYGDLAKAVQEHLESAGAKEFVQVISQEDYLASGAPLQKKLTIITGNSLVDGSRITRERGIAVIKKLYSELTEDQWILIDQAFDICDEEILEQHLNSKVKSALLSARSLEHLSEDERKRLFEAAQTWIVYKPRNLSGRWLEEAYSQFSAKDIAAIKQYHYQALRRGKDELVYDTVPFPLEAV